MKKTVFALILMSVLFVSTQTSAQNDTLKSKLSFSLNADLVSRFYFRGVLLSSTPNIQPYGTLSYKGLSFGVFGSYGLSNNYAETDLSLSYTVGSFTMGVTDYYAFSDDTIQNYNYFNVKKHQTLHDLEGSISYNGTESFPLSLTVATYFLGNDDWNGDGDIDYSTYLEVAYTAKVSGMPLKLFVGGTPERGMYASKTSLCNVGVKATKILKFSGDLEVPLFVTFAVNPDTRTTFAVFGMTF